MKKPPLALLGTSASVSCLASWAWLLHGLADQYVGIISRWPRLLLTVVLLSATYVAWGVVWARSKPTDGPWYRRWTWLGGAQVGLGVLAASLLFVDLNEDPCPGYEEGNDVCYVSSFEPVSSTVAVVSAFAAVSVVSASGCRSMSPCKRTGSHRTGTRRHRSKCRSPRREVSP